MSAPLVLNTSVTLAANGTAVADSAALASPFREPLVIDEVRWSIRVADATRTAANMGYCVRTALTLGQWGLTNGMLPIWILGTSLQENGYAEEVQDAQWVAANPIFSNYRWRFPKPLYVAPGQALRSGFQRIGDSVSGNAIINVAYSGRYALPEDAPKDGQIDVPWATAFLPGTGQTTYISSEQSLDNPFLVPLKVQRLTFREANTDYSENANSTAKLTMKDSTGTDVIKDMVLANRAIDYLRRAWTFQRILSPRERYDVKIAEASASKEFQMAMIGSRKERIA